MKIRASRRAMSDIHETETTTKIIGKGKKGKGHRMSRRSSKKRSVGSRDQKVERKVMSETEGGEN